MTKHIPKRTVALSLLLVGIVLLCACSSSGTSGSSSSAGGAGSASFAPGTPVDSSVPSSSGAPTSGSEDAEFAVFSDGIQGGVLADEYGMRGSQLENGVPTRSLPLRFENAPEGTACYAVLMTDPDAVAVAGYEWDHWLAANITLDELPANAGIDAAAQMLQGTNSFGTIGYGGPTPPNAPHTYLIQVWALDAELPLEEGFDKEALLAAIEGHELATAGLTASYSN